MIRRPPRSTLLSLHDALPICAIYDALKAVPPAPGASMPNKVLVEVECASHALLWEGSATWGGPHTTDRKSTRLNSSHANISYAVFCLKKKKNSKRTTLHNTTV